MDASRDEIERRIAAGASFADLCARPGMPHLHTFNRWRRERPDFAAAVDRAARGRVSERRLAPCPRWEL